MPLVVENIHRHIEEGLAPLQAAIKGAREIATPVISMTLTLAAVYAPIGFLTGITEPLFRTRFFHWRSSYHFRCGGVDLVPMMCSKLMRGGTEEGALLAKKLDIFGKLKTAYLGTL